VPQCIKQSLGIGLIIAGSLFTLPSSPVWADVPQQNFAALQESNQVVINGKPFVGAWAKWTDARSGQPIIGLSDSLWMRYLGGALLDSTNPGQQPVQWFSKDSKTLFTQLSPTGTTRYLAISDAARQWGWQIQVNGSVLDIQTGPSTAQSVKLSQQSWGQQLVMMLDRAAPWRMATLTNSRTGRTDRTFALEVDTALLADPLKNLSVSAGAGLRALNVTPQQSQTLIQGTIEGGFQPQVSTLENPSRLVLDLRQPLIKPRRILWAPGIEWRTDVVSLGQVQFPVIWLAINPRQPRLKLLPFWSSESGIVGLEGLAKMAQRSRAAAAINGGFFGGDRQSPLGAIRRDGTWISSPILNRGVIAWDTQGRFRVGRLMLQEQVSTSTGAVLPLTTSNSGYPQKGMARYTPLWGATYTPLLQNEQVITVVDNQVVAVQPAQSEKAIAIPKNGALFVARSVAVGAELAPGVSLQYQARASRPELETFPNIVGAGPLLVEQGRVVMDAIAEKFSPAFVSQSADRSGIGQTADGTVLLAVTHNRIGGAGPTLGEWAQIMQRLGCVNALNLDGGSSTTLYLGGQLLDRHPSTAARVQNGIGVFLQPSPQSRVGSANIEQKSLR
jgi:hypothetical protein